METYSYNQREVKFIGNIRGPRESNTYMIYWRQGQQEETANKLHNEFIRMSSGTRIKRNEK